MGNFSLECGKRAKNCRLGMRKQTEWIRCCVKADGVHANMSELAGIWTRARTEKCGQIPIQDKSPDNVRTDAAKDCVSEISIFILQTEGPNQ